MSTKAKNKTKSRSKSRKRFDNRHGGPYDRGSADAYYGRSFNPHYYLDATYSSEKVIDLTAREREAYRAGWSAQKKSGISK